MLEVPSTHVRRDELLMLLVVAGVMPNPVLKYRDVNTASIAQSMRSRLRITGEDDDTRETLEVTVAFAACEVGE